MRTKLALLLGAALLAAAALAAGDQQPKVRGDCCAPKGDAKADASEPLRCSLTGKTVDRCCCTEKDGKLYCPLAKKTIESCCCVPASSAKAKGEAAQNEAKDEEPMRCGRTDKGHHCCARKQEKGKEN